MRKAIFVVLLAVFGLGFVVSPAWATTCPVLIKKAKDAMAGGKYDKATMDKAKALVEEGDKLHAAGKHDDSVKKLNEALKLLGLPTGGGG